MTVVPLPDVPCVRIRLLYSSTYSTDAGSRIFLSYTGSAPTAANCDTLASDVASAWNSNLASLINENIALTSVDVLDIATDSGNSGLWTGDDPGTYSGVEIPFSAATNIEFVIARRYRGGKPRIFLPPPAQPAMVDGGHWTSTFVTAVNTGWAAFAAALEALTIGSMGSLKHVNLSYYKGFTNVANSSGRERAVPTYRASALHDDITGYSCKAEIGSQRRRRIATTP